MVVGGRVAVVVQARNGRNLLVQTWVQRQLLPAGCELTVLCFTGLRSAMTTRIRTIWGRSREGFSTSTRRTPGGSPRCL